jgi:rare lipoprotein A
LKISLLLVTLMIAAATLHAADSTTANTEGIEAQARQLQREWQQEWRASDSLRIVSVLKRIRADSLLRSLARIPEPPAIDSADPTDSIIAMLQLRAAAYKADAELAKHAPKRGQTIADSVTFEALRLEADTGMASYYAEEFHGRRTSSGEVYDMHTLTCAHRWLPFGTRLRVTNLANGKQVVVSVTDRGPFKQGRLIDVSKGAAEALDMIRAGTARVAIAVAEDP